ncbi:type I methionyl aminopeptidase [Candidatus Uhrbacteria bacterium]|nr:type I methionyl aminopeptidase [Candidatus Uhrbacteria bacterium]
MITIKKLEEIEIMRQGGQILAQCLVELQQRVVEGTRVKDLDTFARTFLEKHGGRPAFLGYGQSRRSPAYPATLCVSINDEVVHGIGTRDIVIRDGDIVGLDIGVQYPAQNGLFTDMAVTVGVGAISDKAKNLIADTKKSLEEAIQQVRAGAFVHDISKTIQHYCESRGYGVVRDLTGHGVGYAVHEDPPIFCYYDPRMPKVQLAEGMVICIEPMVTLGTWQVNVDPDRWTIRTADGSWAAHFEHTIAVTKSGYDILTRF